MNTLYEQAFVPCVRAFVQCVQAFVRCIQATYASFQSSWRIAVWLYSVTHFRTSTLDSSSPAAPSYPALFRAGTNKYGHNMERGEAAHFNAERLLKIVRLQTKRVITWRNFEYIERK